MLVDAVALCAIGLVAVLLPLSKRYRTHLVRRMTRRTGAHVPAEQVPALRARAVRRARAVGDGVLLAGVGWIVAALLWPDGAAEPTGGYVVVSLAFVFGAGALAVVEIARPGDLVLGRRVARPKPTTVADYLPREIRVLHWTYIGIGLAALALTLAISQSRWIDTGVILRSPATFLLATIPLLALLSELAIRRVLAAPQPARDQAELYWQDAIRADTLMTLTVPPALVSLLALTVSGATLDDAASAAAVASGEVGPEWSLWLLIGGYLLPVVLIVVGAAVVLATNRASDALHFREQLWPEGQPAGATTGDA